MAVILITGANRGIGLELARQAAARGDQVLAACRDPAGAAVLQALAASNDRIRILPLDVTNPDSIAAAQQSVADQPVDVLINNAGILMKAAASSLAMDFKAFEQTLTVNTLGPLRVSLAFLPNLRRSRNAKLIAISTRLAVLNGGGSGDLGYSASKTAMNKIFQGLAVDLRGEGIAVLMLSPGWVATDMGGAHAPVQVETSAAGLLREIDALTLARSGQFRDYTGQNIPW